MDPRRASRLCRPHGALDGTCGPLREGPPALKVAQLMAGAPEGGAELFFERLSIALARAGDAVLPVIRRNAARTARLAEAGLVCEEATFGGPFDFLTRPRLRKVLRSFAPRVAVAWMSRAARLAPQGEWVLVGRLGGYYGLDAYRRCDHLVGNTRGLVEWILEQGWLNDRVHYLPNFAPDHAGAEPADREALGVPEGVRTVLALGRLHPNKAFDVLIRAVAKLPRAHAVIAGDGPERSALLAFARKEGVADRVHFCGWRSDVAGLLGACDVLVCPSRHEPLGNVVIDGWSAERPVVACAAEGPRELIVSGETGLLVPLENATLLAEAIASVITDAALGARLAAAGRARFQAEFAEAPVVAQWRHFLGAVEKL